MESLLADKDFTELRNRLGTREYQRVLKRKKLLNMDRIDFWNCWPQSKDGCWPITHE